MRRDVAGLTSWNVGENFASLGIGHFIVASGDAPGPFEESFPAFVRPVARRGQNCQNRCSGGKARLAHGIRARVSRRRVEAKNDSCGSFSSTIDLQADFLVERRNALPKILAVAPGETREGRGQFSVSPAARSCY
jgi:hypothetical protein